MAKLFSIFFDHEIINGKKIKISLKLLLKRNESERDKKLFFSLSIYQFAQEFVSAKIKIPNPILVSS